MARSADGWLRQFYHPLHSQIQTFTCRSVNAGVILLTSEMANNESLTEQILAAVDASVEGDHAFIHKKTAEIRMAHVAILSDDLTDADSELLEENEKVRYLMAHDDWVMTPDQPKFLDYRTLREFGDRSGDTTILELIESLIELDSGVGAIVYKLKQAGVADSWNEFRRQSMAEHFRLWVTGILSSPSQ